MIASVSLTEETQLNKGQKACKPPVKRSGRADEDEPEFLKTQELFRRVQRVLNTDAADVPAADEAGNRTDHQHRGATERSGRAHLREGHF